MALDPYGSHMSVLFRHALLCKDSILELGMGWYSTPMLAEIAKNRNLEFNSYETNPDWYVNFQFCCSENTQLHHIKDWNDFHHTPVELVFLDNSQLVKDRYKLWPYLSSICRKLIMHDANVMPPEALKSFKYSKVYTEMPGPPTIVASHSPL